jgi:DNA-binding PadR family transcriptional regulator
MDRGGFFGRGEGGFPWGEHGFRGEDRGRRGGGRHDDREGFFGGRGGRGGPPFGFGGPGGRGGPPFGFGGPGGPGGPGFRSGRKLSAADLQLILLALIGEKARHGYELIKALETLSNGFYVPSPGVIYPALTYLEEAGDTMSEAAGSRKLYHLTDTGRAHLTDRRAEADAMLHHLEEMGRGMDRLREAFAGGAEGEESGSFRPAWGMAPEVLEAMRHLREALADQRGATRERWLQIADTLRHAASEIVRAAGADEGDSKK